MEINNKIIEIKAGITELKEEFEKLIISNPYLLYLTNKNKNSDIQKTYQKFKKYDLYKYILIFILGFVLCLLVFGLYYIDVKNSQTTSTQSPTSELFILKAMPVILLFLTLLVSIWVAISRTILNKDEGIALIAGTIILWLLTYFSFIKDNSTLILFMSPLIGYFIIIFSLYFIYSPLSSTTLRNEIKEKIKSIQDKLDLFNNSLVQESHSNVLNKIVEVENIINRGSTELSKIHSMTVLNSLRLELIKNSVNGINLVEDWKFLDLSQNMVDQIMTCENKKITIIGDLSFLSTKEGLKMLVDSISIRKKSFEIYFTGEKVDGESTIKSKHCEDLVKNFKEVYNSPNLCIHEFIKLKPILSESFTGIGYIGLRDDHDDDDNKRYCKVFAYVSSLLINDTNIGVTRANPFVFSWEIPKTDYFRTFVSSKMIFDTDLKVLIGNIATKSSELLK